LTASALAALLAQLRQTRADVLIVCSFVTDGIQLAPALHDLDHQHQAVYMTVAPTNAAWTALGAKGHHVFTPTQARGSDARQ
jgi:hypothetical protein